MKGLFPGRGGAFAHDVVVSFTGMSLSRVITLASLPFITRIYAPADLGVWAIILALSTFFVPIATMRYEVALVIAPTRRMAASLVILMAAISAITACIVLAIFVLAPPSFLGAISGLGASDHQLLLLVPLVLALLALQASLSAWLVREHQFWSISFVQLVQAILTAAGTILLPLIWGATAVTAAAAATGALGLATLLAGSFCWQGLSKWTPRRIAATARLTALRFKVYPTYFMPYSLSAGLVERIVQVVLASAYSVGALGAFYVARQLTMAPATLLAGSLRQVLFAHSARQDDNSATRSKVRRLLHLLTYLLAPALAYCVFWLDPALTILMGGGWETLGQFAWWVLFPASSLLLTGWLDRLWDVAGRQRTAVVLQLASDGILIAIALLSPRAGLDAIATVALLSIGSALYNIIWLCVTLRLLDFRPKEILSMMLRLFGLLAFWTAAHALITTFASSPSSFISATALLIISISFPALLLIKTLRASRRMEIHE